MSTYDRFVAVARMKAANPADPEHDAARRVVARVEARAAQKARMGLGGFNPQFRKEGDSLILDMAAPTYRGAL
jgi:hypothetical protein